MQNFVEEVAERLIDRLSWLKAIAALVVYLAALVGLGIFNEPTALVFLALGGISLIVLPIAHLKRRIKVIEYRAHEQEGVINFFTRIVNKASGPSLFDLRQWHEKQVVGENGDTLIERWLTLQAGEMELPVCWTATYQGLPMDPLNRKNVTVEARSWEPAPGAWRYGTTGPRYRTTATWEGDKQSLYILFDDPLPAHEERHVYIRWFWPKYSKGLLDGHVETAEWVTHRPFAKISTEIIIKKECGLSQLVASPINAQSKPPTVTYADGDTTFFVEYENLPAGAHVGFRVDRSR